jgi:hypothetical protein
MICPFCQFELDVETLSCPRCHAAFPQPAKPFGFRIRTMVATGSMLLLLTFMLVECVVSYLPGWPKSQIPCCSGQLPIQPLPNMKSPEVNALITNWQHGSQAVWTVQPNTRR